MSPKELWRLGNLRDACVDVDFLKETYGINWPIAEQFDADASSFAASKTKTCEDGKPNRFAFERFLKSQRLLARKYSAAGLGMEPASLDLLISELPRIGLSRKYEVYPGIIDESLNEDLVRSLPGLRFRTFGTHDSFCELLHGTLRDALKVEILPLFCATADQLGGQRMYASTWDIITLLPLSLNRSVWLDFKKPLALPPDRCSKLFFAQHYDELRPHLFGSEDPRDLSDYVEFARRSA